jgi:hypothetical protein
MGELVSKRQNTTANTQTTLLGTELRPGPKITRKQSIFVKSPFENKSFAHP